MARTTHVATPDGRTLEVHDGGDPAGRVVVSHHGTPGSGVPYERGEALAAERGLRLIGYDRPGYGGSDRHPRRSVADAAAGGAAIPDGFGGARLAAGGSPGGGPPAPGGAGRRGGRRRRAREDPR